MFMRLLLLSLLVLFLHSDKVNANPKCIRLKTMIKQASHEILGSDYPFWYNIGLVETETNCQFKISIDGHGSIGYGQITKKVWHKVLYPLFPDYDKPSLQHFYALSYILKVGMKKACKLWQVYAWYNGGAWVYKECKGSCDYEGCKKNCRRGNVCVRFHYKCLQYRSACDINYQYPVKVYHNGLKYKEGKDGIEYW